MHRHRSDDRKAYIHMLALRNYDARCSATLLRLARTVFEQLDSLDSVSGDRHDDNDDNVRI